MGFGKAVRRLRTERGWKQEELARRSGIRQGYISDIELGKKENPTQETLVKLAGAFGISVPELLQEAGITTEAGTDMLQLPADVPSAFVRAFLLASRGLSPRQQETVLRLVQSLAAETEEAETDARQARRELIEPRTDKTRPVEQNSEGA